MYTGWKNEVRMVAFLFSAREYAREVLPRHGSGVVFMRKRFTCAYIDLACWVLLKPHST